MVDKGTVPLSADCPLVRVKGLGVKKVLAAAWPIMLSYVPIGLACGVLGAKCGIGPAQGFLLSVTVISGGAQFMINNLWLAGMPAATIVASVCAVSLRFALYSASLAPHLQKARKRTALAMAATLIEEGYGVTLSKLTDGDKSWTFRHALALNGLTIGAWALSVAAGGALGGVVDIPTAVASFTMTALFTYLLWGQVSGAGARRGNVVAAGAAIAAVVALKAAGATAIAVPAAAVIGVAAALLAGGGAGATGGAVGGAVKPTAGKKGGNVS